MVSDSSSPENIIHTITTTILPTGTSLPSPNPETLPFPQSHYFPSRPQTLPFRPFVPLPKRTIYPLKLSFNSWPLPRTHSSPLWAQWVYTMKEKHHQVWRKSGILEAVMGSVVRVCRDEEVLLGVMERWCPETNTFVFTWGEATITLEDVIVLGGYPVIGDGIWSQDGGRNEDEVVIGKLVQAHRVISRGTAQKACHRLWMKAFMGKKTGIEHEAFLACWLSRFVFPVFPFGVVNKRMFRMAVCLARGDQVALGPIVLASVYRDLRLLKSTMDAAAVMEEEREDGEGSVLALMVWAPLQLVQVWIWERFIELRPKPVELEPGQPRLARWHGVERNDVGNVRPILQSAGDMFLWRPYTIAVENLPLPGFYRETEEFVVVDEDLDDEIKAFARCLRVSELVGIDCIEMYSPHRVAMQFGFDQDIPDHVPKLDVSPEFAWFYYTRPIKDLVLYIPSRHVEADVTVCYLKWQRESVMASQVAFEGVPRRTRGSKRVKRSVKVKKEVEDDLPHLAPPPGFHEKYNKVSGSDSWKNNEDCKSEMLKATQWPDDGHRKENKNGATGSKFRGDQSSTVVTIKKEKEDPAYDLDAPPGFYKKYNQLVSVDLGKNDENCVDNEYRRGEENAAFGLKSQAQSPSSLTADNEANLSLDLSTPPREMVSKTEAATGMRYGELGRNIAGLSVGRSDVKSFFDRVSKLGETISLLRKVAEAKSLS